MRDSLNSKAAERLDLDRTLGRHATPVMDPETDLRHHRGDRVMHVRLEDGTLLRFRQEPWCPITMIDVDASEHKGAITEYEVTEIAVEAQGTRPRIFITFSEGSRHGLALDHQGSTLSISYGSSSAMAVEATARLARVAARDIGFDGPTLA